MNLPSILTKDVWFYEANKEVLEKHLGKPYCSYSTASSFADYTEDFIKSKLVGIPSKETCYTALGTYLGEAVETGEFSKDNQYGFEGMENVNLKSLRPKGAEYERFVLIDYGDWVFIGFIDRYLEDKKGADILDFKTGAMNKKSQYTSDDYTQVVLYARAIELEGKEVSKTGVYFIERVGSHIKPPLKLTKNHEYLPLAYNKTRVAFAEKKLKKAVKEISDLKDTYDKFFN